VRVSEQRLDIENHAAAARAVGYVLSGVVTNAKVEGADELDYDAKNGAAIAFVTAPSRATLKRTLRITEARASTTALETLTKASVEALATTVSLPAAERAILRAALPRVAALEAAEQAVHELERRNGELDTDLTRNQEHLAAASSGEGGANPIATRIVSLERARDAGHARLASLRDGLPALKEAVTHVLEGLPPLATSS
jgi:hypothetical protein